MTKGLEKLGRGREPICNKPILGWTKERCSLHIPAQNEFLPTLGQGSELPSLEGVQTG